jgi:hypothetical protein
MTLVMVSKVSATLYRAGCSVMPKPADQGHDMIAIRQFRDQIAERMARAGEPYESF